MILDCLVSLPKPVGRGGLARILIGSLRAPVAASECRHHGRLYALGEVTIIESIDEMIAQKLLRQYERNGYPVLAPTLKGRTVAEEWLADHPELAAPTATADEQADESDQEAIEPESAKYTTLQKALYSWRRRTADEQGVPTYVIMGNDLMFQIAARHPQNMDELSQISGMGAQRLERYGPVILDLVKLNPEGKGDVELLAAQQEALAERAEKPKAEPTRTVSPQVERRIYLKMQELRQKIAVRERGKPYLVAGNNLLKSIAHEAPRTEDKLLQIVGFRSSGLRSESGQILEMIREQVEKE